MKTHEFKATSAHEGLWPSKRGQIANNSLSYDYSSGFEVNGAVSKVKNWHFYWEYFYGFYLLIIHYDGHLYNLNKSYS